MHDLTDEQIDEATRRWRDALKYAAAETWAEMEPYWPRWLAAIEARAARRERERIAAAVMELHRPIRVYDECDHDDCQADPIEVYDYMACTDSAIGWACETCCYDDEMPLENCPHGGCHNGVEWADSCPTHKLMEATDDHR